MRKGALTVGKIVSLVIGIIGIVIVLVITFATKSAASSLAVVWAIMGVPSALLIILSVFLSNKIKKEFPKTQAEIELELKAKEYNAEQHQIKKEVDAERKARNKQLAKEKKDAKERAEREKVAAKQKELDRIANNMCSVHHIAGLPLAENAECNICYGSDEFIVSGGGNTFRLPFQKITDICIKTDEEIQKQYVSSLGGAVGGYMLFGGIGAAIGGRAKKKTIKKTTHNFIITYIKNDSIDYLGFEVESQLNKAKDWVSRFDPQYASKGKDIIL